MHVNEDFDLSGTSLTLGTSTDIAAKFKVVSAMPGQRQLSMAYYIIETINNVSIYASPDADTTLSANDENKKLLEKQVLLRLNDKNQIISASGNDHRLFSKEQLNAQFGIMLQAYPDKPVKIGDGWKRDLSINMRDINITILGTYTLTSVTDSIASVEIKGSCGGRTPDIEVSGNASGFININMHNGRVSKGELDLDTRAKYFGKNKKENSDIHAFYSFAGTK